MDIKKILKDGDVKALAAFAKANNLVLRNGKLVPRDDEAKVWAKGQVSFWDQRQQARKILLNSLYGALLNEALRFSDERMGQSVTLTGRSIVRHMNSKINEIMTGDYQIDGPAICYADTDSSYFSAAPFFTPEQNDDLAFVLDTYMKVADATNESFPEFMNRTFNASFKRGAIIAAGLELLGSTTLFIKKKKYAVLKAWDDDHGFDENGKAVWIKAPGKLKAMGLDLKRADTPKPMQAFLQTILMDILQGAEEKKILNDIADFRLTFKNWDSWTKGSPKRVSNLYKYSAIKKNQTSVDVWKAATAKRKKEMIPGHVEASMNWNTLLDRHGDKYSMRITDGSRIVVCKLKPNGLRLNNVAYPVDEPHLPDWFKTLPFDDSLMEQTIIDKKIANLISVLGWNLKATTHSDADELIMF
jgi:DNA polymerase elongation subunit (family B)